MMRSGTTLAEQILAAHRSVFGAGELNFWNTASATYKPSALNGPMKARALSDLANDYLRQLENLSADALPVVDKTPGNSLPLGLIHAALPHSRGVGAAPPR